MLANILARSASARDLGVVCLWSLVGLLVTALFTIGLAAQLGQAFAELGQVLATAG
jgi:hypothetical protein